MKKKEEQIAVAPPREVISLPIREGTLVAHLAGKKLSRNDGTATAEPLNEREAEALHDAVPADVIERALSKRESPKRVSSQVVLPAKRKRQIVRGDVLLHKPSGRQVTVVKPEVDVTRDGIIKHRVMTRGIARKCDVRENLLEDLP